MITITIIELGNNRIGFSFLNEYNQTFGNRIRVDRSAKEKVASRLRRKFMQEGKSVFCNDLTVR